jgi:hypothetical protein
VYLALKVDGAEHDSSDLLADRGIVPWVRWLPVLPDVGDLDEPGGRAAQIDEESERVMTQHHSRHDDDAAREAYLCRRPFLAGVPVRRAGRWLRAASADLAVFPLPGRAVWVLA